MVPGLDTGLIARINTASGGGLFARPTDEDRSSNAVAGSGAARAEGAPSSLALAPFEEGVDAGEEGEGPFFVSGLNGLLAPPSIAAVQEDRGGPGEEADSEAASGRPDAAVEGASEEASPEEASSGEDGGSSDPNALSEEEQKQVDDLKERDAEVRRHEQAHKAVGGQYAGAISYSYESGPDGKRYAVGGEVPIDASKIPGEPEATIQKLQQVRRAALAPAEPSGADRAVAAKASQGIQEARAEQIEERSEELEQTTSGDDEANETTESSEINAEAADGAPQEGAAETQVQPFEGAPENATIATGRYSQSDSVPFAASGGEDASAFDVSSSSSTDGSAGRSEGVFDLAGRIAERDSADRRNDYSGYSADAVPASNFDLGRGAVTLDIAV